MQGLVIEGGGRRGIFAAGVLDCLAQNNISFEYIAGVSSGAQAALDFAAGQSERTKTVIIPPDDGWTGIGLKKMLAGDLNKIIYEYPYTRFPFDFDAFFSSKSEIEIVATDCATGEPGYFSERHNEKRLLDILLASCSLPVIYKQVTIDGREYIDGSIADAIPFARAMQKGCDRVLVILSKPVTEPATNYGRYKRTIRRLYGKDYPVLTERLFDRLGRYEAQCRELDALVRDGKAFVLRPPETLVGSFEMNKEKLEQAYQRSYSIAESRLDDIRAFLEDGITE